MFNYGNDLIADTTLAIFSLYILKKYFEIFFQKKDDKIVGFFCWALYFIWQLIIGSINIFPAYIMSGITFLHRAEEKAVQDRKSVV